MAIARAISFAPKVLILDEPTANLSVMATERLLETMAELKRQGVAQIIISHRLNDIFAVGDRVMVLKRGRNAGERPVKQTTEKEVLELIVRGGDELAAAYESVSGSESVWCAEREVGCYCHAVGVEAAAVPFADRARLRQSVPFHQGNATIAWNRRL